MGGAEEKPQLCTGHPCHGPGARIEAACVQCELVFTGDISGCGLSGVCVAELFNFVLCFYEEIFMHTSPTVYLMLISIPVQSSAMVSLERDSLRSTRATRAGSWAFMRPGRRKWPSRGRQTVPNSWVIKSQL